MRAEGWPSREAVASVTATGSYGAFSAARSNTWRNSASGSDTGLLYHCVATMTSSPMDRLLAATRAVERDHFWFRGFRRFVTPLVADAVAGRSAPRLLDCGCGTG